MRADGYRYVVSFQNMSLVEVVRPQGQKCEAQPLPAPIPEAPGPSAEG